LASKTCNLGSTTSTNHNSNNRGCLYSWRLWAQFL